MHNVIYNELILNRERLFEQYNEISNDVNQSTNISNEMFLKYKTSLFSFRDELESDMHILCDFMIKNYPKKKYWILADQYRDFIKTIDRSYKHLFFRRSFPQKSNDEDEVN
jgi:hypothetical protein